MYALIDSVLLIWQIGLIVTLALFTFRAQETVNRAIALVALAPLVLGALAVLSARFDSADYMDIGLVIAMLGVAQTLTVAQMARAHSELR